MNVFYLSLNPDVPANDYWCYAFLNDFLKGNLWKTPDFPKFEFHEGDKVKPCEIAIVVIPGEYHASYIDQINKELNKVKHVVLFIMADEEANFPIEKIDHPSVHIWVMHPRPGRHDKYGHILTGYPPHFKEIAKNLAPDRNKKLFFSGQITHSRRKQMWKFLPKDADINQTEGFTKGFEHQEYYQRMVQAKVVPAPSGPYSPDSFRLVESLELMCIPIADERDPSGLIDSYWCEFFGEQPPFPIIKDWSNLEGYMEDALSKWPDIMHQQTAWWINYKRDFAYKITGQLNED